MRSILSTAALLVCLLPSGAQEASGGASAPAAKPAPLDPEVLALFDYDASLDLDVQEGPIQAQDGYDLIDLSYASPLGGRVPAFLYVPRSPGPWAGMLVMHGMPGDRNDGRVWGPGYARGGALCLAISAPWARVAPGQAMNPITLTEQDRKNQIQLMVDLRRGIDLLLTFDEVDPQRLGYVGGSYGGAMGGLLAGIEKRLAAYALVIGDGGLVAHESSPGDPIPPAGMDMDQWLRWKAWMEPIEPIRFVGHAAPAHLLFQNGRTDELVPEADGLAYQAAGSEPKTCLWYADGHGITRERMRDQAEWFAERIGIDPAPFLRD